MATGTEGRHLRQSCVGDLGGDGGQDRPRGGLGKGRHGRGWQMQRSWSRTELQGKGQQGGSSCPKDVGQPPGSRGARLRGGADGVGLMRMNRGVQAKGTVSRRGPGARGGAVDGTPCRRPGTERGCQQGKGGPCPRETAACPQGRVGADVTLSSVLLHPLWARAP